MTTNIKSLTGNSLKIFFAGALLLAGSAPAALAAEIRYTCIAKVGKRFFTDGATITNGRPCWVDPAGVERLVKAKRVSRGVDQVNFDYLWSQEYYTVGNSLVDVRPMSGSAAPQPVAISTPAAPVQEELSMPSSTDTLPTPSDDTRQSAADYLRRHKKIPVAGVGLEGTVPVLSLGLRGTEWAGTLFFGLASKDQSPQSAFERTAADSFGNYDEISDSYKFDASIRRLGLEVSKRNREGWNVLGGLRYDVITETVNKLHTVKNFDIFGAETGSARTASSGDEKLRIFYLTLGLGHKLSEIVNLNARLLIPLNSDKSSFGNKYEKTVLGLNLTIDLL